MATLAVTNTLASGADIIASEHNTNYSDIVTYVNDRNDGSATWERCLVTDATSVPLIVNNSTGTQNIANFQDNGTNIFTLANGGNATLTGSGTRTDLIIDNTASDGDPVLSFQLSGTTKFSVGVDDGDLDILKFGTTAIGTSTNLELDGTHVFFPDGLIATPGIAFIVDPDLGILRSGVNQAGLVSASKASLTWDDSSTATHTRIFVFDVDRNASERVTVGAADSGGSGFKLLRIQNT